MTLRDRRQQEFADIFLDNEERGILHLCPRFGKIYCSINILSTYPSDANVLIAYPDSEIKKSWQSDFKKRKYKNKNIVYVTHLSLHKHIETKFDLVIIDEIHLLSDAQIEACRKLFEINFRILGLTGTLSYWTERKLEEELDLHVIGNYPIALGIKEKVIVDYEINIVKVNLDDRVKQRFKSKFRTEKKQFDRISWVIKKLEREEKNTMFLRLARMRIIQNSLAKLNKTKELLQLYKNDRILVFCGTINIANSLGIPSHHSKAPVKELFDAFISGKHNVNHMAVVKIGNTGITYTPLNKVVINYFDSNGENLAQKINRCMSMEYDNPDKKAIIYIVTTNEPVELKWLDKALEFFEKDKIKYL